MFDRYVTFWVLLVVPEALPHLDQAWLSPSEAGHHRRDKPTGLLYGKRGYIQQPLRHPGSAGLLSGQLGQEVLPAFVAFVAGMIAQIPGDQ
jgi:hypothetical protein